MFEDKEIRAADALASAIHQRQRWEWRELRHHSFRNRKVRLTIAALAEALATARQTRVPRHADASRVPTGTVEYNGTKFRSLAEARWAVFFHTVGLNYEYETKRCDLDGVSRLPDFWLPELGFWFEVKVDEPMDEDKDLCQRLADSSDHVVLMAIGAPEPRDQLLAFSPWDATGEGAFPRQD